MKRQAQISAGKARDSAIKLCQELQIYLCTLDRIELGFLHVDCEATCFSKNIQDGICSLQVFDSWLNEYHNIICI
jgi:hypothetical protein